ncbi:MAG TPA: CerR family C-terminal domain-containing protein [Sideroxyarcus sp.]|nr:CerR family C-terminal domain-containing protein [Sideroxyarcus sp.]
MNAPQTQAELQESTRDRLLVAAREVFAEQGFKGATVREICRRAEVNVAAVNYHFNGKEALFMAALELEPIQNLIGSADETGSAEQRFARFIREFMLRVMNGGCSPHSQLIMRELLEPSPALDGIAREVLIPLHQHLTQLVRDIVGDGIPAEEVRRCVFSILGQCTYYRNSKEMNRLIYPELKYDEQEIEATARQITGFSLAGLRQLASR